MTDFAKLGLRAALSCSTILAAAAMLPAPAMAQTTTGAFAGSVNDASGAAVAGAQVVAVNTGTNVTYRATTDAGGRYRINGIRPGSYRVTVTSDSGTYEQVVSVSIGQVATLNIALGAAEAETADGAEPVEPAGEEIVVTGSRLVETRTSEVATNVSQEQIRRLPQTDRNFLSFAALAPGVRYNDSETDKGFQAGAGGTSQVNVFIDGISLKNKSREGGIAGQQNSRGNPFGQLAVQEFRVLTQNYKAEYEQAGTAIITSITKSGTNEFHGEVFGQYTDKSLTERGFLDERAGRAKPEFERKQYGISLGGPIIKDRLFFFATYEGNDQDRALVVDSTGSANAIAAFEAASGRQIEDFEGAFVSPFRGDFYFGKLTLTPDDNQVFDLSFSRREETDIQAFGGNTSFESAENKVNRVDTYLFKWTYNGENFINEFSANYLNYKFNPTSLNPDLPNFDYAGVINFGGKDSTRREIQEGYTLRNDLTWTGLDSHTIKGGARVEITDIRFFNQSYIQPRYTFNLDPANNLDFTFPSEARLGLGSGRIYGSNTQIGLYLQDDWEVTDRLELNLGLRWDYETNGFANNYITPPNAAAALRALPSTFYFDPEDYITDGTERDPFAGAFQPRIGFSWDVKDDQSLVVFGGVGRYYDRNNFNNTVDEISRTINPVGLFRFSRDGLPRNGQPTTIFDPSYLTREGLLALIASSGREGLPELFAVPEDVKPPVTDQASFGVRKTFGRLRASLSGSYQRGRNGYTNLFATRQDGGLGNCCDTSPVIPFGYANVLIGVDDLKTRYKALYFTLDKDYTEASGWGFNIAYTLSKAEIKGPVDNFTLFSLDEVVPDDYPWRATRADERHRLVISGIVDLPLGFQFSTLSTFGSGTAYPVTDNTAGTDADSRTLTVRYPQKNCAFDLFAFCEVNLTLAKRFRVFGAEDQLEFAVDLLNAFDNKNFRGFDDSFNNAPDPVTGQPIDPLLPNDIGNELITFPRRLQFRASYRF